MNTLSKGVYLCESVERKEKVQCIISIGGVSPFLYIKSVVQCPNLHNLSCVELPIYDEKLQKYIFVVAYRGVKDVNWPSTDITFQINSLIDQYIHY